MQLVGSDPGILLELLTLMQPDAAQARVRLGAGECISSWEFPNDVLVAPLPLPIWAESWWRIRSHSSPHFM